MTAGKEGRLVIGRMVDGKLVPFEQPQEPAEPKSDLELVIRSHIDGLTYLLNTVEDWHGGAGYCVTEAVAELYAALEELAA